MPSDWLYIDTNFPAFTGEENLEQRVATMQNYLYMLVEQFRYTLRNLDLSNMNSAAVEQFRTSLTDPIYARIGDDEGNLTQLQLAAQGLALRVSDAEGNITQLGVTAAGLASRVSDAEGNISTLSQTATSLTSRISDAEGNISSLSQTATSLASRISDAEGGISTLEQTVGSITLSVSNGESSSTIKLMVDGVAVASKKISFTGAVTFTDLETEGATVIHGGNIDTNTLQVSDLYGKRVYLRTSDGETAGYIIITDADTADYAVDLTTTGALRLNAVGGDVYICNGAGAYLQIEHNEFDPLIVAGGADFVPNRNDTYSCGDPDHVWSAVYATSVAETSDLTKKNSVVYGLDAYDGFFDRLKPISYLFNAESGGPRHTGLGAQDVEQALIDCGLAGTDFAGLVKSPRKDEAGQVIEGAYNYALRYAEFIPLLIGQVQKLKTRINDLEARI